MSIRLLRTILAYRELDRAAIDKLKNLPSKPICKLNCTILLHMTKLKGTPKYFQDILSKENLLSFIGGRCIFYL